MMMGTVPTSIPQIILLANWILAGRFREKWQALRTNKLFFILIGFFVVHLIGLLYTRDVEAGFKDVRTKLPMVFLPVLFFSSGELTRKEFLWILRFFLIGCLTNTLWCNFYTHVLHHNEILRNASRFMSHIRLGLYLNVAIAAVFYLYVSTRESWKKAALILLASYFVFCFYSLGLASGMINFLIISLVFALVLIIRKRRWFLLPVFGIAGVAIAFYVQDVARQQLSVRAQPNNFQQQKTPWGSSYIHFEQNGQLENGNYVLINIELTELRRIWNRRVPDDTFSYQPAHNLERYEVLVRYLASMGKNKDSAAVMQLSDFDIQNIRKNIVNVNFPEWSFFHRRVYEFVNEFDEFKNDRHINGHSVTMRPYFWKAAAHAIAAHPFIGVGTGDVQSAMNASYIETNTPLKEEWFKRPHNQFLTVTLAVGLTGLLFFVILLVGPILYLHNHLSLLYWVFFIIAVLSFCVEDTLETQAGQTFFAFFNTLFLSIAYFRKIKKTQIPEG